MTALVALLEAPLTIETQYQLLEYPVHLITESDIIIQGNLKKLSEIGATLKFQQLTLSDQRKLITFLFCRPQRWVLKNTAGELQSLWLLIISFFRGIGLICRAILNRKTAP
jgi:cellulose synthase (UDP-forming)